MTRRPPINIISFADAATTPDDRRDRLRRLEGGDVTRAEACEQFCGYGTISFPGFPPGFTFTYGQDFQSTCLPEAVCTDALLTQSLPGTRPVDSHSARACPRLARTLSPR